MRFRWLFFPLLLILSTGADAGQGPSLEGARELYYSAAFGEALDVLEELRRTAPGDRALVDEYRAACLVALGREEEARDVVASLIRAYPDRHAGVLSASPATGAMYDSVRIDVLSAIVRERYAAGATALDNGRPADAAQEFAAALHLLDELPAEAARQLSDFGTLSAKFLSVATALHRPVPRVDPDRFYSSEDPGVIAPQPISERVPQPPDAPHIDFSGTMLLELLLSPSGEVERAYLHQGIHSSYDAVILAAARTWRYTPATLEGEPVRFRKHLRIDVR